LAIIGLDRYWEPLCHRWNKLREIEWPGYRWQLIVRAPWIFAKGIVEGTFSVILHTVIGLSNLVIHPLRIWQSWRRLREGRAFSWKASSASAGQDMRG